MVGNRKGSGSAPVPPVLSYSVSQIKEFFQHKIPDRILLIGPPGVGKTTMVEELAREEAAKMGRVFIDVFSADPDTIDVTKSYLYAYVHAPSLTADELAFVAPQTRKDGATRYDWTLPSALELFTRKNAVGLVFIDEITNVQDPSVESLLFAIILEKRIVVKRLSDKVKVVAAGNPPEVSGVANELSAPLLDRFQLKIEVKPPSINEWIEWMSSKGKPWDRRVAAFLAAFERYILKLPGPRTLEKYPTPRSWSALAWMLADGMPLEIAPMVVGPEAGVRFMEFARINLDAEDVWRRPEHYLNKNDVAVQYLAATIIAEKLAKADRETVKEKMEKIANTASEFAVLIYYMSNAKARRMIKRAAIESEKLKEVLITAVREFEELDPER